MDLVKSVLVNMNFICRFFLLAIDGRNDTVMAIEMLPGDTKTGGGSTIGNIHHIAVALLIKN